MTTRFRVGDVITWNDARNYPPARVKSVENGYLYTDLWTGPEALATLVRRPLRVGDVLQLKGTSETQKVNDYVVRNAAAWVRGGWTHEDGTPIDAVAPAVEAKLDPRCATCLKPTHVGKCVSPIVVDTGFVRLDPPLGGNNSHGVGGAEREAEVQNAYNQRNNERAAAMMGAGAQAEIQSIQRAIQDAHQGINAANRGRWTVEANPVDHDAVSGKKYRVLEARANRLSDECGALASANRELLVENAQLRRENERLTRKARR